MYNFYSIYKYENKMVFIFIMLILFSAGCKDNEKDLAKSVFTFKKENAIDLTNSDFFKNKTTIPLEVKEYKINEYSHINVNPSVKKDGDNLFVYSNNIPYAVFRFDMEGNFINKIGDIGTGPNEFTVITDLIINKKNSTIEVLSNGVIYSYLYDGAPVKYTKIDIPASSFSFVSDYYWFYVGNNNIYSEYRLFQTDAKFNIIKKYLSNKSKMLAIIENNFRQSPYNTFRENFYYNMYAIQQDSLSLLHAIRFPGMEYPSVIHEIEPMKIVENLRNSHYASIACYLENANFIYLFVLEDDTNSTLTFYHWIINKNNNQEKILRVH